MQLIVSLLLIFGIGTLALPVGLSLLAAQIARQMTDTVRRDSRRVALSRFAPAFMPIGPGFWAAHYGFHVLIGVFSIVPAFQSFLLDHGIPLLDAPDWSLSGITDLSVVGIFRTLALLGGFFGSLFVAQRHGGLSSLGAAANADDAGGHVAVQPADGKARHSPV